MDLDQWASELNKRVYNEWKANYPNWTPGFKVLYGPPLANPEIMIVSLNPGGGSARSSWTSWTRDQDRFERGDFSPPAELSYLVRDNKMARKVRDLLGKKVELLKSDTVAFPVCFFRSEKWGSIPTPTRKNMKRFCHPLVKEIIQTLSSKRLLVIGFNTYNQLTSVLGGFTDEVVTVTRADSGEITDPLAKESRWQGVRVFACVHPTGFRLRRKEWEGIKLKLQDWLVDSEGLAKG